MDQAGTSLGVQSLRRIGGFKIRYGKIQERGSEDEENEWKSIAGKDGSGATLRGARDL